MSRYLSNFHIDPVTERLKLIENARHGLAKKKKLHGGALTFNFSGVIPSLSF